jgi:hypothetical protein
MSKQWLPHSKNFFHSYTSKFTGSIFVMPTSIAAATDAFITYLGCIWEKFRVIISQLPTSTQASHFWNYFLALFYKTFQQQPLPWLKISRSIANEHLCSIEYISQACWEHWRFVCDRRWLKCGCPSYSSTTGNNSQMSATAIQILTPHFVMHRDMINLLPCDLTVCISVA